MFKSLLLSGLSVVSLISVAVMAQPQVDREQIRWKSESQVRALLGEPNSVRGPIGTHAQYTLWKYDRVTVAFANRKAFHLFENKRSARQSADN
ncbi:MAG: hypothetical protein HKN50_08615 [Gammaproteobacteria bacterium]|nr:hypothetical protein [Gammaproteobacteria bacterium]